MNQMNGMLARCGLVLILLFPAISELQAQNRNALTWKELPSLPEELGLAGPFAGVHNDALIVAGGANFPRPVWETDKVWHDRIYVLTKSAGEFEWKDGGTLPRPTGYGAAVSTSDGVVCIGGNDAENTFDDVFLLAWDPKTESIKQTQYPSLPKPCAFGAATRIGNVIYLAGGQNGQSLESAMTNLWSLDLSQKANPKEFVWRELPAFPGPTRALNLTAHQHNGVNDCVYVMSGRRQRNSEHDSVEFLKDVWEFTPATNRWRKRSDAPRCMMAGTAIGQGQSNIFVLGGADGSRFFQSNELKDDHPGFPKEAFSYHAVTDSWTSAGEIPKNHVTTIAVKWDNKIIIPSGEVRPRVRSPKVWSITSKN